MTYINAYNDPTDDGIAFGGLLAVINDMEIVRRPYGNPKDGSPQDDFGPTLQRRHFSLFSEREWNDMRWNPLPGSSRTIPDPTADPKPSWSQVIAWFRDMNLERHLQLEEGFIPGVSKEARNNALDSKIALHNEKVHVGEGISHMSGLAHMVEHANLAGESIPHILLRNEASQLRSLWLQADVRTLLYNVVTRQNHIEAAHNILMGRHAALIAEARDKSNSIEVREQKKAEVLAFRQQYEKLLAVEMEKYDPDTLPEDIPTLRALYDERIEGVATERFADIKNSRTQQGVDLDPSCIDQAKASEKISVAKQLAQINLDRATTKEAITKAYNDGVAIIRAVEVENVPVFTVADTGVEVVSNTHFNLSTLRLKVDHPAGTTAPIPGAVAAGGGWWPSEGLAGRGKVVTAAQEGESHVFVTLTVDGNTATRFRLLARNLCGPKQIYVVLTPPPAE